MAVRKNVMALVAALVLVAGGMAGCENWMIEKLLEKNEPAGGSGGVTPNPSVNIAVTGVAITNGTARGGVVDSVLIIKTEVYPANATNREVEWRSSDSEIADVVGSASGATVHLLGVGAVEIRVKTADGGKEAVCRIDVVSTGSVVDVTSIELSAPTLSLQVGEHPVTLTAIIKPGNATDHGIKWDPGTGGVVKVENGLVTALTAGTATITATSESNPAATDTCEVTVTVNAGPVSLPMMDEYRTIYSGTIASTYLWAAASTSFGDQNAATANTVIDVASFAIGRTAVRYELWYIVRDWGERHGYKFANKGQAGSSGGTGTIPAFTNKDQPVTTVSWRDVVVWCNAYSEITGKEAVYRNKNDSSVLKDSTYKGNSVWESTENDVENLVDETKIVSYNGYRLPTETEWEYAARGGVPGSGEPWSYKWAGTGTEGALGNFVWNSSTASSTTHSVGQKTANSAGLYDMSGNVWEWCFTASGTGRLMRGGAWSDGATSCSVAFRRNGSPGDATAYVGFRSVCH